MLGLLRMVTTLVPVLSGAGVLVRAVPTFFLGSLGTWHTGTVTVTAVLIAFVLKYVISCTFLNFPPSLVPVKLKLSRGLSRGSQV